MTTYNYDGKRLNIKEFQHPADRKAVDAVMAMPGLEKILDFVSKNSIERVYSFMNNSSRMKISEEMSPKIHKMLWEAAQMYGQSTIPEVYLERNYTFCINLDGMSKPYIILPSAWLEAVDDRTLWAVLSSQIAGIQAKHGTLEFLGNVLQFTKGLLPFGVDAALDLGLKDWQRNRIYTIDRAILLGGGSFKLAAKHILFGEVPESVIDSIGLDKPGNVYYQQATEFLRRTNVAGTMQKLETLFSSGQWTASRYIELYNWYFSGEYYEVLEGSIDQ